VVVLQAAVAVPVPHQVGALPPAAVAVRLQAVVAVHPHPAAPAVRAVAVRVAAALQEPVFTVMQPAITVHANHRMAWKL